MATTLSTHQAHRASLAASLASLTLDSTALETQELAFLRAHNARVASNARLAERVGALACQLREEERVLERLEGTNVWGDVFCIGVGGGVGDGGGRVANINGLRLGKGGRGPPVRSLCPTCLNNPHLTSLFINLPATRSRHVSSADLVQTDSGAHDVSLGFIPPYTHPFHPFLSSVYPPVVSFRDA